MQGTIALTYFPCAWCQPFNHSIDLIWFVTCLSHLGEKILIMNIISVQISKSVASCTKDVCRSFFQIPRILPLLLENNENSVST